MKKWIFFSLALGVCLSLSAREPGERIRETLQPYIDSGDLPGVVTLIADCARVLDVQCLGYADLNAKRTMSPDDLFWIASQSKPIAGAAVMLLVDEGKLDLDEPVTTYLPELAALRVQVADSNGRRVLENPAGAITLRRLLSHTAGLSWVAGVQEQMQKIDVLPFRLSRYVSAMTPLVSEPGTRYSYSNQGINLAATVVEAVSGMPYETFLEQRLFGPLGMASATFWPSQAQCRSMALSYKMSPAGRLEEVPVNQLQYPLWERTRRFAEAAGGLFCSPADLVKFYQMIAAGGVYQGKRYLSEAAVGELGLRQTPEGFSDAYGLGWSVNDRFTGHGGAYGTDSRIYRRGSLIVMYFVQIEQAPRQWPAKEAFDRVVEGFYGLSE